MPNYRCCVGGCNNDSRYPDRLIKRSHVTTLKFHYFPKDEEKRLLWVKEVEKGLVDFVVSNNKVVCSNHFQYAKPTFACPVPTIFMSVRSNEKPSPNKRRKITYPKKLEFSESDQDCGESSSNNDKETQCSIHLRSAMLFADLTKNTDVNFFTGLKDSATFSLIFEHLSYKAINMHYWKGLKNTAKDLSSPRDLKNVSLRVLSLEQEFLMTMMRVRLGLLIDDLAFRFNVSSSLVSSIFTTWIKLISLELSWLIHWPDRCTIRRNLPSMFRKYYIKCCVIIDCSELYIETPSSLDIAAACWSNYKHHFPLLNT